MLPSASSAGLATGCRFSATVTAMLTGAEFEELPLVAMVSSPEVASSGTRVMTKSSELTTMGASTSPKSTRGRASSGGLRPCPVTRISPPGSAAAGTTASMCGLPFTFFLPRRSEMPMCEALLLHIQAVRSDDVFTRASQQVEIQQQLHDEEAVDAGANVVHHDAGTFRQLFEP